MPAIEQQHSHKDASNLYPRVALDTQRRIQAFESASWSAISNLSVTWWLSMHHCPTGQKCPLMRHEQAGCNLGTHSGQCGDCHMCI